MVVLLSAAVAGLASTATVLLAVNSIVDQQHRIRGERLRPRSGQSGVATWVQAHIGKVPLVHLFDVSVVQHGCTSYRMGWFIDTSANTGDPPCVKKTSAQVSLTHSR